MAAFFIGLSILVGLAAFPGLIGTYKGLHATLVGLTGQDNFAVQLMALVPYVFLVGLFVSPLIHWMRGRKAEGTERE